MFKRTTCRLFCLVLCRCSPPSCAACPPHSGSKQHVLYHSQADHSIDIKGGQRQFKQKKNQRSFLSSLFYVQHDRHTWDLNNMYTTLNLPKKLRFASFYELMNFYIGLGFKSWKCIQFITPASGLLGSNPNSHSMKLSSLQNN